VQGIYAGSFATQFIAAADAAGANLTLQDLNAATPQFAPPVSFNIDGLNVASLRVLQPASGEQPATAGFAAVDKNGGAVACDVTMNNLFGTGRIAAGTGILLAASPNTTPPATLAASVTTTPGGSFRAASTGTGQAAISYANTITCPGGVPGGEATCTASADPHGQGLAIGGR
jgi:gamma-glutamyltranspeptidase/glutathione hydrolase